MQKFTRDDVRSLIMNLAAIADKHGFEVIGPQAIWKLAIVDKELPIIVTVCGPGHDEDESGNATPFIRTVDETLAELDRLRDWYAKEIL